jgi:hypothetical protein
LVGRADCGECGGKGTKTLIVDRHRGVFSKCQKCGFCEWEWTYGDSLDYLEHLAKKYHITYKELIGAIEE